DYFLKIPLRLWKAIAVLSLSTILGCITCLSLYFPNLGKKAFVEWYELPLGLPVFFALAYLCALYTPAYVLDLVILRSRWVFLEKLVFYPVIGSAVLGFLAVVSDLTGIQGLGGVVLLLMFFLSLLYLCSGTWVSKKTFPNTQEMLEIDAVNSLVLLTVITFNVSTLFIALGGEEAFLRGDMYSDAHRVAFLSKYGLSPYFSSPAESYPIAFSLSWLSAIRLLPFPYVNGLVVIAFFNQFYFILALYLAAKVFLGDSKRAALAVVMWTLLSGFSWMSLLTKTPSLLRSNEGWMQVLGDIFRRYGLYSGAIVSQIYADGHALTRLWALGLLLAVLTLLLKLHMCNGGVRGNTVALILATAQLSLGHVVEVLVVAEASFILALVLKEYPMSRIARTGILLLLVNLPLSIASFRNVFWILTTMLPPFASFIAVALRAVTGRLSCKTFHTRLRSRSLGTALLILILYVYGLALLAFFIYRPQLDPPIVTLWYTPAIEWGFLGLGAFTALACILARKESLSLGLEFSIYIIIIQIFIIVFLNIFNVNFFYLIEPYPMEPIFFRPFLALIASHVMPPRGHSPCKWRRLLLVFLLMEFLAFGALNHVLSASHWKWNDARNPLVHLGLTKEDRELINVIYEQPRTYAYEYVASIYSWAAPSAQLVYASGAALFPGSLGTLLNEINSKEELAIIVRVLPTPFILVPLEELHPNSTLINVTKGLEVVSFNGKYVLVSSSQLISSSLTYNLTEFVVVSSINFDGGVSIKDGQSTITLLNVVNGALLPREGGYVEVVTPLNVTTLLNPLVEIKGNITLHSFRSTRGYASVLGSSRAEKLELKMEEVEFKVYASFEGKRMYIGDFSIKRGYTTSWFAVRPVYSRWVLEAYINRSYVDPLTVIMSTPGKTITLLFTTWMLLTYRKHFGKLLSGLLLKLF
ncbi:MAG: hypothetical protein QXY49_00870, partial [Thermofilaceae archaeon]